jgi:hypothetical protein
MSRTFNADPNIDPATARLISQLRADVFDELSKKDAQVKMSPKQYIINPDFRHWLDNDGFSAGTGGRYSATLWYFSSLGNTISASKQNHVIGQSEVPTSSPYYAQAIVTDDATGNSFSALTYYLEDVRQFSDKDQVLSIWCKASSGTPNISIEGVQSFGSGGSPSALVYPISPQKIKISSSWNRYDIKIKWPSISGKTIGTDQNSSFAFINIWLSSGSDYNSRNDTLGHQAITLDVGLVTLVDGTDPQPYVERTQQEEINLISRYFRINSQLHGYSYGPGLAAFYVDVYNMRANPILSPSFGTQDITIPGIAYYPCGALVAYEVEIQSYRFRVSGVTGLTTVGVACEFIGTLVVDARFHI